MRIGIDFDNTIVSYDELFHKVALERDLVSPGVPANKIAVRDYLRGAGQEDAWTEMQGYVYGARMNEAQAYPGAFNFLQCAAKAGHSLAIVSHKTRHPFLGPTYDLHVAARSWIETHLSIGGLRLVPESQVFFELTKEEKLARIATVGCDMFIDDLPEILSAALFPTATKRFLFDPERHHENCATSDMNVVHSWGALKKCLSLE